MNRLRHLRRPSEQQASVVEYGLMMALVIVLAIAGIVGIAAKTSHLFDGLNSTFRGTDPGVAAYCTAIGEASGSKFTLTAGYPYDDSIMEKYSLAPGTYGCP